MRIKIKKGFSLVEMLIVIMILGTLAVVLMFSLTPSTYTANASRIVSELNVLRTAALAYYTDDPNAFSDVTNNTSTGDSKYETLLSSIARYTPDPTIYAAGSGFLCVQDSSKKHWFVRYDTSKLVDGNEIRKRLTGRAKNSHLLSNTKQANNSDDYYQGGNMIFMFVI